MLRPAASATPRSPPDDLVGFLAAPLVLLLAPAGFGKTTLLEAWQEVDERPFAWVRCGPAHRDRRAFRAAVASTGGGEEPSVLVLDDLHRLARARHRDVADLIRSLPDGSQVAIATRARPALPLARMRAERRVTEVGPGDLALSASATAAALAELVPELTRAQRLSLAHRIGGWPAGIQLAAVALADAEDLEAAAATFDGDDRAVTEYVREEALAGLGREDVEFLARCSLLDQLSGDSCNAVLRRTGSSRVLRRLARDRALLVPLDRREHAYRLASPLLGAALRSELHHEHPEIETRLRVRTIRWYAEHGDLDRAVEQAIAGGAAQAAGELIWTSFLELSGRGRTAKVRAWLDALGGRRVAADATLALAAAHCALTDGDAGEAERWAQAAAVAAGRNKALRNKYAADLLLLDAALGARGALAMGTSAAQAAELYGAESPWRCAASLYRGIADVLTGQPLRAAAPLEEAARRGSVASPLVQVGALAQLGLIALFDGQPVRALDHLAHAAEQVDRCRLEGTPTATLADAVAAVARSRTGQAQEASAAAQRTERALAAVTDPPPWCAAEAWLALADARLHLDELAAAQRALRGAEQSLARTPDASALTGWRDDLLEAADAARGRRLEGDDALTKAELRTLQYLPSHLSFREIGAALCLSPNTVKTQSRAVYRKLGVSSRSAAVERARGSGLLPPDPADRRPAGGA